MVCSVSDRGHKRIRIQRFEDKAVEANTAEDVVDHNLVAEESLRKVGAEAAVVFRSLAADCTVAVVRTEIARTIVGVEVEARLAVGSGILAWMARVTGSLVSASRSQAAVKMMDKTLDLQLGSTVQDIADTVDPSSLVIAIREGFSTDSIIKWDGGYDGWCCCDER